jgi:hypothetical protein
MTSAAGPEPGSVQSRGLLFAVAHRSCRREKASGSSDRVPLVYTARGCDLRFRCRTGAGWDHHEMVFSLAYTLGALADRLGGCALARRPLQGGRVGRPASRERCAAPLGPASPLSAGGPNLVGGAVTGCSALPLVGRVPGDSRDDLALASVSGRPKMDLHRSAPDGPVTGREGGQEADPADGAGCKVRIKAPDRTNLTPRWPPDPPRATFTRNGQFGPPGRPRLPRGP